MIDGPIGPDLRDGLRVVDTSCGAVVSFLGTVRNEHHGKAVVKLDYDCHRSMAEAQIRRIRETVIAEADDCLRLEIWHGLGEMPCWSCSVAIHAASPHRDTAFIACRAALEHIKQDLPVWKKEYYADGTSAWLHGS